MDEILRFLAVSVALVHLDNYIGMGHNYYLYEYWGTFLISPWDLNMRFGGFDSGLSEDQLLSLLHRRADFGGAATTRSSPNSSTSRSSSPPTTATCGSSSTDPSRSST